MIKKTRFPYAYVWNKTPKLGGHHFFDIFIRKSENPIVLAHFYEFLFIGSIIKGFTLNKRQEVYWMKFRKFIRFPIF
jgi:hypothetical protein